MALTYADYLKLDELLSLQKARSVPPEHDEMLFIVIHQVYELWFKLLLHELEKVKRDFAENDRYAAIHTFKRMRTVMKTLVGQLDILETMTPMSFSSFRDRLETASGFQSAQFREMEFVLGYKRPDVLQYQPDESKAEQLRALLEQPSVVDHFHDFLRLQGVDPTRGAECTADCSKPSMASTASGTEQSSPVKPGAGAFEEELLHLYKREPSLAILFELMTDFDEGLQEWRYRHVKLVERTIGQKHGTGGSLGVEFLKKSLFQPVFTELWAIRHRM